MNKENEFTQFGNRNVFEGNRFADYLIQERSEVAQKNPSPLIGGLLGKNRQDVSPRKLKGKLQEGDLVFRAGAPSTSRGINFSEISRKFNEQ